MNFNFPAVGQYVFHTLSGVSRHAAVADGAEAFISDAVTQFQNDARSLLVFAWFVLSTIGLDVQVRRLHHPVLLSYSGLGDPPRVSDNPFDTGSTCARGGHERDHLVRPHACVFRC